MADTPAESHSIRANTYRIPGQNISPSSRNSNIRFRSVHLVLLLPMAAGKTQNQYRNIVGMFFCNPEVLLLGCEQKFGKPSSYCVLDRREHLPFRLTSRAQPQKGWRDVSIIRHSSLIQLHLAIFCLPVEPLRTLAPLCSSPSPLWTERSFRSWGRNPVFPGNASPVIR